MNTNSIARGRALVIKREILNIFIIITFCIYIFPTLIIINIALKTQQESVMTQFYQLPKKLQLNNLVEVFKESRLASSLLNSVLIAFCTIVFCIAFTSMASYIIARNKSKFSKAIYFYFIINFFVPGEATLIAVMQLMKFYHFYGHLPGLIILYTSGSAAMAIYLFCAYIKSIPGEIDEAAIVDGAGMFTFFWRVLFPLMKPVVVTYVIIIGINIYNDVMTPLIFLRAGSGRTVTLEILSFTSSFAANYPLAFSGIIIATVPILLVFFGAQKYIIGGLTTGTVKG